MIVIDPQTPSACADFTACCQGQSGILLPNFRMSQWPTLQANDPHRWAAEVVEPHCLFENGKVG